MIERWPTFNGGGTSWQERRRRAMRLANMLAFAGGVVLGLAFFRWRDVDLVLLAAGLMLWLAGGTTAYRVR